MGTQMLYFSQIGGHAPSSKPGFEGSHFSHLSWILFSSLQGSWLCSIQMRVEEGITEKGTETSNVISERGFNLDAGVFCSVDSLLCVHEKTAGSLSNEMIGQLDSLT